MFSRRGFLGACSAMLAAGGLAAVRKEHEKQGDFDDFIRAILVKDHRHCCDVVTSLNSTIAGIYAHMSAEKGGEALKIPAV